MSGMNSNPAAVTHIQVTSDSQSVLAGWFTAAMAAFALRGTNISISHATDKVEPSLSHGSLTLQADVLLALQDIGLTESVLINRAHATPFLANKYIGWLGTKHESLAGIAKTGAPLNGVSFIHHLTRLRNQTNTVDWCNDDFSLNTQCAVKGTFARPSADPRSILSSLEYGLRVDAVSLCELLKQTAINAGRVTVAAPTSEDATINTALGQTVVLDCRTCSSEYSEDRLPVDSLDIYESETSSRSLSNEFACLHSGYIEHQYLQGQVYSRKLSASQFIDEDTSAAHDVPKAIRHWKMPIAAIASDAWHANTRKINLLQTGVHQLLDDGGLGYRTQQLNTIWPLLSGTAVSEVAAKYFNRISEKRYGYWHDMALLPMYLCNKRDTPFWLSLQGLSGVEDLDYLVNFYQKTGVFPQFEHYPADLSLLENTLLAFDYYPLHSDPLGLALDIDELEAQLTQLRRQINHAATHLPQI